MNSPQERTNTDALLSVVGAVKNYGLTQALSGVNLDVNSGEVLGLIGHNGAGKSTLMRMITAEEGLDEGAVYFKGARVRPGRGNKYAQMAYQETSLAAELTVGDNALLADSAVARKANARKLAAKKIEKRLREIFTGCDIRAEDYVDDLSIAQRQMVEIARATLADDAPILLLDEPTESLTGTAVKDFYAYVKAMATAGKAIILISHRLNEVIANTDRIAVLKDGAVVAERKSQEATTDLLFNDMSGELSEVTEGNVRELRENGDAPIRVEMELGSFEDEQKTLRIRQGEIIGLAGIEGQGQEEILKSIWHRNKGVAVNGEIAYVPGDRQRFGIFPLWRVRENLSVSASAGLGKYGIRSRGAENALVRKWVSLLNVRGGQNAYMTGLSGGNQQKVIVARAFATTASIILLDDPFRGVDIQTKAQLYRLIEEEADQGRTVIWYSSENSEMRQCDRVFVIRAHKVAKELEGNDITDAAIISASFAEKSVKA